MGAQIIEGCIWQGVSNEWSSKDHNPPACKDHGTRLAQFARMMENTAFNACMPDNRPVDAQRQGYRIHGGMLDGVLFDISEEGMQIHLNAWVPNCAQFDALCELAPQLTRQLRQQGWRITLEVIYVPDGTR